MWAAVHLHDHGVDLARVQMIGLQHPTLENPAVWCGELMPLRLRYVTVAKPRIEIRKARLCSLGQHVELAWAVWVGGGERDHSGSHIEIENSALATGLLPHIAIEVARVHAGYARAAGGEVDPVPFRGPAEPDPVPGAHVVDHRVIDTLVECGGQAARGLTGEWHHPQTIQQACVEAVGCDEGDQVAFWRPRRRAQQ